MRAPLSWLRDFTPVDGPPEEIARALSFLGPGGRGHGSCRASAARHRRRAGPRHQASSRGRPDPARRRGRRRRRSAPDLLRGLQYEGGRPRPPGHAGDGYAQWHGDRPAQTAGRVVQRDAVLRSRAWRRARRPRPGHFLAPARVRLARPAGSRRSRFWRRCRFRPGDKPQPFGLFLDRRHRPRPGRRHAAALLRARPRLTWFPQVWSGPTSGSTQAPPALCRRFTGTVIEGVSAAVVAPLVGAGSPWPVCAPSARWSTCPIT